jgi:shikimate kinase
MRFIFIGPRSIGKSTVGKALAQKLNLEYFDFDEYVEKKIKGINQHIKNNSVESYRTEEEKILKQFVSELPEQFVVSVGGGTVASQFKEISERNVDVLKRFGKIVYLSPSENINEATEILHEREQKRKGDKDYSETLKLFELRKPVYEKVFDLKFEVKNKSPSEIVNDILLKVSTE